MKIISLKDLSKSPMLTTIENFIEKRHGFFKCDILTTNDMSQTLRAGIMVENDILVDPKNFTNKKISMILRQSGDYYQVRSNSLRLWIVRDEDKYLILSPSKLVLEYERQMKILKGDQN